MKDRKEEILGLSFYPHECGSMIDCCSRQDALKAMEQYAEEMAVGFANYVLNNVSKSFYDSSINITTNNDYYKQYLESVK